MIEGVSDTELVREWATYLSRRRFALTAAA